MEENRKNENKVPSFLQSFSKASKEMIATSDTSYQSSSWDLWRNAIMHTRDYTPEEVLRIINRGSLAEQQLLSRNYFYKDGYYKQIIIHFATLLKYVGLLIPNPATGKTLSTPHIQKKYFAAMDYVEGISLPTFLANCAVRALVDGCYFGAKVKVDTKHFVVIDLPCGYCCSRFKDEEGNDLVEFDVRYFNTITDEKARKVALEVYPSVISKAYKKYVSGKGKEPVDPWVILPSEIGVCFKMFDGRPLFLSVIPKVIEYDESVETERERDLEEVRKIIVQKIPHLNDGRLVFEPDEAEEMHAAAVGMLKGNKNAHVLTTYADVEAITSKTSAENANNVLERMEQNIYAQAGVSGQVFAPTGSGSLNQSLNNDLALMMYLANQFSRFLTNEINGLFANSNIKFKYTILPVSYYNAKDYVDSAFKLSSSGYSLLIPAVAEGLSQKDLCSLKELENDVLKLDEVLIPLSSSYTQSGNQEGQEKNGDPNKKSEAPTEEGGRPLKEQTEKTDETVRTQESKNDTGGGS